jgi:hypothetical protein
MDFGIQMCTEEQARVSCEIDANVCESLRRGIEDLWKRLREVVAQRLGIIFAEVFFPIG